MIQYEEDGHNVTQKYSIFVLQAYSATTYLFFIGQNLTKKSHFEKKNRIRDGFVKIMLSCDGSRIIEIISGDIWESMMLNSPK